MKPVPGQSRGNVSRHPADTQRKTGFTDIDHDYRADLLELLRRNKLDPIRSAGTDDRVRTAAKTIYLSGVDRCRADCGDRRRCVGVERGPHRSSTTARGPGLTTTAGDLKLRIPKLRTGSFFRSLLELRKQSPYGLRVLTSLSSCVTPARQLFQSSGGLATKQGVTSRGLPPSLMACRRSARTATANPALLRHRSRHGADCSAELVHRPIDSLSGQCRVVR
jgi:hypothetical protein